MFDFIAIMRYAAYLEIVKALDRLRRAKSQTDRDDAALQALLLLPPEDFAAVQRTMDRAVVERASMGGTQP